MFRKPSDPHAVPSVFPTFLLPSIPFRRKSRQSSSDSNVSTFSTDSQISSSTSSSNPFSGCAAPVPLSDHDEPMAPPTGKFLHGNTSRLHCSKCATDLCLTSQIISKGFTGRHGRAYLVQGTPSHIITSSASQLPNTYQNKAVPRNLVTGPHTVSDISCAICGSVLGWKYVEATEESQKYKVGKFILETKRIRIGVSWENEEEDGNDGWGTGWDGDYKLPMPPHDLGQAAKQAEENEIEFDSQDEDECEDLFAGVWSTQLARKRREKKALRYAARNKGGLGSSKSSRRKGARSE